MAESISTTDSNDDGSEGGDGKEVTKDCKQDKCEVADCQADGNGLESTRLECAVCLQGCIHPVQLPCGHIFCFLCVKGVANQSKRCAMCRKELPVDYLERPHLVGGAAVLEEPPVAFDDGNQWYYEGHNGWWQYDERTSAELEAAYKSGLSTCELLIAGFLYVIDFQAMVQYRRNDPSRRRRIKRDLVSIPKKGIAGLRVVPNPVVALSANNSEEQTDAAVGSGEAGSDQMTASISAAQALSQLLLPSSATPTTAAVARPKSPSSVPVAPNNTPQTPHTPSQDSGTSSPTAACDASLHHIVQDMEHLLLLDSVDDEDEEEEEDGSISPHYLAFSDD